MNFLKQKIEMIENIEKECQPYLSYDFTKLSTWNKIDDVVRDFLDKLSSSGTICFYELIVRFEVPSNQIEVEVEVDWNGSDSDTIIITLDHNKTSAHNNYDYAMSII